MLLQLLLELMLLLELLLMMLMLLVLLQWRLIVAAAAEAADGRVAATLNRTRTQLRLGFHANLM